MPPDQPAVQKPASPAVAPARRVLRLPVTVSVHLANRPMELKQLLALTPGSLITFNKPCDELLELFVNNRRYARGEAVKVGENFGLKIDKIGPA
ncbi:MAG TPA: FliM/FliN family flagellar motor switch protein [Planctomycetaceae bacterium]|nr:FliM/FliN family flagellar motor switch protein [Planctomycetaceae bacterium]